MSKALLIALERFIGPVYVMVNGVPVRVKWWELP